MLEPLITSDELYNLGEKYYSSSMSFSYPIQQRKIYSEFAISYFVKAFVCGHAGAAFNLYTCFRDSPMDENKIDLSQIMLQISVKLGDVRYNIGYDIIVEDEEISNAIEIVYSFFCEANEDLNGLFKKSKVAEQLSIFDNVLSSFWNGDNLSSYIQQLEQPSLEQLECFLGIQSPENPVSNDSMSSVSIMSSTASTDSCVIEVMEKESYSCLNCEIL